jgi:hypothetical protein
MILATGIVLGIVLVDVRFISGVMWFLTIATIVQFIVIAVSLWRTIAADITVHQCIIIAPLVVCRMCDPMCILMVMGIMLIIIITDTTVAIAVSLSGDLMVA